MAKVTITKHEYPEQANVAYRLSLAQNSLDAIVRNQQGVYGKYWSPGIVNNIASEIQMLYKMSWVLIHTEVIASNTRTYHEIERTIRNTVVPAHEAMYVEVVYRYTWQLSAYNNSGEVVDTIQISHDWVANIDRGDIKSSGAALTYATRYFVLQLLRIHDNVDDIDVEEMNAPRNQSLISSASNPINHAPTGSTDFTSYMNNGTTIHFGSQSKMILTIPVADVHEQPESAFSSYVNPTNGWVKISPLTLNVTEATQHPSKQGYWEVKSYQFI